MFHKADYSYSRIDGILVIEDLCRGSISVTNDIENVLYSIDEDTGWLRGDPPVIYRDSQGMWDGVTVKGRRFYRFFSVGAETKVDAINKLKELMNGSCDRVSANLA